MGQGEDANFSPSSQKIIPECILYYTVCPCTQYYDGDAYNVHLGISSLDRIESDSIKVDDNYTCMKERQ